MTVLRRSQRTSAKLTLTALFLFFVTSALCQSTKQSAAKNAQAATNAGKQVFESICASCHGLDAKGAERGPDIATRTEVIRLSDEETLKVLREGVSGKGMPGFEGLGTAKLTAVLAYLRTLQGKGIGADAPISGNPVLGRELFRGKAKCSTCHMANGAGGFLGPDLSNYGANHVPADIRAAIVSPETKAGPRRGSAEVITKDGKSYSGVVRNEDNFSLQLQSLDGSFHLFLKSDLTTLKRSNESLMPTDYGSKLTAAEIDNLAAYLAKIAKAKRSGQENSEDEWLE